MTPAPAVMPRGQKIARGPCTPETGRCRAGTNYAVDTPQCCHDHQRDIMDHIADVFERHGVAWWADYGTLLGAVRNQGIIPHDKDGDICVFGDQWDEILAIAPEVPWTDVRSPGGKPNQIRMIDGFQWVHKKVRSPDRPYQREQFGAGHSIKVRRSSTNHNNVDIFPWYARDDGTYYRRRYVGVDRYKGREFPADRLLPLGVIEWEGRTIPAPMDPEWFCEHRYGPEWRTPLRRNNDGVRR